MIREQNTIKKILADNGVILGYVFGSYAKGKEGPLSDFDVAVVFKQDFHEKEYVELEARISNEIAKLLKIDRVDIVNLKTATSPLLKHRAVFEGEPILVKDKKNQFNTEKRIMEEYEDTKYLRSLNYKIMHKQIKEGSFGDAPLSPAEEMAFKKHANRQRVNK